ncbi:MAG: LysR family transcriptional regulator [Rhodobacteraceae bacterium]|nr:MAG: LysR family transcriptional regulator [Paracoccaceae bacterium]
MTAQTNWDDLRFVLAVADHGSVARAARALSVNHATVLRRIAAFETRHGLKVFERTPNGYQISPERRALVEALREAQTAVGQVERLIDAERPGVANAIRITSTDAFCHFVLPGIIAHVSRELTNPISLLSGNAHLDFARLQADITVRPAVALPEELAGEKVGAFRFGIYADDPAQTGWLGLEGAIARSVAGKWQQKHFSAADIAIASDSFVALADLAAAGRGRTLLPAFVGDATPGLVLIDTPDDIPAVPVWVASHVDLLKSGRLKRTRTLLCNALAERLSAPPDAGLG